MPHPLPIDDALPAVRAALSARTRAVLVAPPGAGKTTRVPLALLDEPWAAGKQLIVLEPRRLAARAAAARMAATLGERVGETVGLRVRLQSLVSARTRIEVVTEGVFTRMILDDPSLEGVAAVLFDEFHERSLDADLGLALALDAQAGLREDLRLLVMSATLDGARVARAARRRAADRERGPRLSGRDALCRARPARAHRGRGRARRAARRSRARRGSILVFLPGQGEIRRVAEMLEARVRRPDVDIAPLYGAMDARAQDRAVAPAPPGRRKIVLATSIAETSLTIEGVRVVIDCGLMRVPRYEPDIGLTRLETVRVSRANADQRRGRAGPHRAGRLLPPVGGGGERRPAALSPQPEILAADLSGLAARLRRCGASPIPSRLAFLDPPPRGRARRSARAARVDRRARRARAASPTRAARSRASRCRRASRAWWSTRRARARRGRRRRSRSC